MKEVWKDVESYKGIYQVSNFGRVRSLDRVITYSNGENHFQKGQILKPNKVNGYLHINLCNGQRKTFSIHRLVAKAFIPNPNNYPQVNHRDENKENNCIWNLEWCTNEYNNHYGTRILRVASANINNPKRSKPILQKTVDGKILAEYPSAREITRQLGYDHTPISKCCYGKQKTAYGYVWCFVNKKKEANDDD